MNNSTLWKTLINQESSSSYPDNASVFKINGNSLSSMYITPVEDCVVDFGDGTKQTYTGNNRLTQVRHNYSESNIYTIKITGNHFRASRNIIEIIQISNSITNCTSMFSGCSKLTAIPETLIIPDSVTNCLYMFSNCFNLTTISEGFTIPNSVTNCSYMFYNCSNLAVIPSTLIIPDSATNCSSMFFYCSSLTAIPSTFTIGNSVTDCSQMFSNCSSLTAIPSTFTIPASVTDCSQMFYGCSRLTAIPSTFTIPASVTNCSRMFQSCSKLTTIPETLTIPNSVTDCSYMFQSCSSLMSDISNIWPDEWLKNDINVRSMFDGCSKATGTVPADKLWNSGKTFDSSSCFANCTSLTNYDEIPAEWK